MRVRDVEGVATHNDPESCVGRGNPGRRSVDRGTGREREAHILASLNHPNIAQVYGVEETSGIRALVMELDATWSALARSLLLEVQLTRLCMFDLRARAATAASREASGPSEREYFCRIALECAAKIEGERADWAAPFALMIRAAVDVCRGHDGVALPLPRKAEESFTALEMYLLAAVAQRRRGQLIAGDEGADLLAHSEAWMRQQGIRQPESMAEMLAPSTGRTKA
jgi:hypothetical protein